MDRPLTSIVTRAWSGVAGRYFAHTRIDHSGIAATLVREGTPFNIGERVEIEAVPGREGGGFRVKGSAG